MPRSIATSAACLAILVLARSSAIAQLVPAGDSAVINRSSNPLLSSFRFRSIGPASMGGRIDDIQVAPSDPSVIYVGYATGGVFKSDNNGTTFKPVFETYGSASIGAIAIHPTNPDVVYVGTGEANNRQTSTFGDGIYKSTDGGKRFTNIGLRETQTIARIVIDPRNPEVVYVAAPGHLFGPSSDRGVYKTTDGGNRWDKIKYIDENTGFTDVALDPSNSRILYAASYQRRRTSCCFNGGGPGSALWKSEDAGKSWTRLSGNGLPSGTLGRIAIGVSASNPNVVYAQIEAESPDTAQVVASAAANAPTQAGAPGAPGAGGGGRGGFDWCNNAGPGHGFGGGRAGGPGADSARVPPKLDPTASGVFRSENKGRSWTATSNCDARPLYFSEIRVDPTNDKTIYASGVHPAKSLDGGKTFLTMDNAGGFFNMDEDQHAFWIDPRNPKHLIRGNDAGLSVSWDQGATWEYVRTMATALAYWVTADMGHPYFVYTGLQDNDSWGGPSATRSRIGIQSHDWFHLTGGDGFQTAVDPTDFHIIYSEQQDGGISRTDLRAGRSQSIRPVGARAARGGGEGSGSAAAATCIDGRITRPGAGGRGAGGGGGGRGGGQPNVINSEPGDTYRFNWNTPVLISPHDASTIWLGGNRLFKSTNRGDAWVASADLTKHIDRCNVDVMGVAGTKQQLSKNDGVSSFSTITAISESPARRGVVWAGTDDGNLQVSVDGGETFTEVGSHIQDLPAGALSGVNPYWISRIEASHFDPGTAYVAIDGHRSDDLHPYIFVTRNYGRTFQSVAGNLPSVGNVQVVREDPRNKELLFAGTEFGLFVSLDAGVHWDRFMDNYPIVRTDDILVHPRDADLIVASHGRSLWIADDITPLEQLTPEARAQDVSVFDPRPAIAYLFDYRTDADIGGDHRFEAENPPRGTAISYYMKADAGEVTVSVADSTGRVLCRSKAPGSAGIHRVQWTLVAPMLSPAVGRGRGAGAGAGPEQGGGPPIDESCSGNASGRGGGAASAVGPGIYRATVSVSGHEYVKPITVLQDIWMYER